MNVNCSSLSSDRRWPGTSVLAPVVTGRDPAVDSAPTLFMIARANELYLTTIDQVARRFREKGFNVIVELFPPGASEEEIESDLEEQATEGMLRKGILVTDRFVQRSWHLNDDMLRALELERAPALDALLAGRLLPIVGRKFGLDFEPALDIGREFRENVPAKYLELYGQCVSAVFKEVFAREQNLSEVHIFSPRLVHHEPFITTLWRNPVLAGFIPRDDAMGVLNGNGYPDALLGLVADIYKLPKKQPGDLVRDWIVRAGCGEDRVRVINDLRRLDPKDYPQEGRRLVIMDRHLAQENLEGQTGLLESLLAHGVPESRAHELLSCIRSQVVVQLPLENALIDLVQAKLFSESEGLKEEEVVEVLYQALMKHVVKEAA